LHVHLIDGRERNRRQRSRDALGRPRRGHGEADEREAREGEYTPAHGHLRSGTADAGAPGFGGEGHAPAPPPFGLRTGEASWAASPATADPPWSGPGRPEGDSRVGWPRAASCSQARWRWAAWSPESRSWSAASSWAEWSGR